ncbi:MAG: system precrRNA processing endoribonuclease protein Cas6 [Euryarchaeota archaeon]|nr:system precrRNA processing endoribonuclease protein Cas6 [Euryarchaeota archaeon]
MPQKIKLTLHAREDFEIPSSEGYQLYSALLGVMREADPIAAGHTHDSPISSISLGPLEGRFLPSPRERHKGLVAGERYGMEIGITDPEEVEIFRAIISPLVLKERDLRLEKGDMRVEELSSSAVSFEDLIRSAGGLKDPCLDFRFMSPTCIQYKNTKITEMFPHREAVFFSLLSKWNAVSPEELKMSIERDDIARFMIEKPLAYETRSAVVNTVFDRIKGHARPIMKQGFTGRCQYTFARNAPEGFCNGITALARFAEYSGVGSAVARGCGAVKVEIGEAK